MKLIPLPLFTGLLVVGLSLSLLAEQPTKSPSDPNAKIKTALAKLPDADRTLAESQRYCIVLPDNRLGSMGTPVKVLVSGKPVFLCCEACREEAVANANATLSKVEKMKKATAALSKLPAADQSLAESQRYCPMMEDSRLGSMGVPVKVMVDKTPVFLCCEACREDALADSPATLAKVRALQAKYKPAESKTK